MIIYDVLCPHVIMLISLFFGLAVGRRSPHIIHVQPYLIPIYRYRARAKMQITPEIRPRLAYHTHRSDLR